ncbi:MAG TPA: hypothetical protein VF631_00565 [Allosphingosinicella sp.]|jgi:hypothetical protein|uniref:hypothetical protein n=1 Tax=Allosphingosinicella sp. TaxID=2823234 RepID=UPI002F26E5ED
MHDENNRGQERAETAKRHDDSELIDSMEGAPSQGGSAGHNISRDIGTRDELKQEVGDGSVTRVRDSDKPEQANLPRFNQGNST